MTDPDRMSRRGVGLAAELLQAGAEEQPQDASVQQTLAALGLSGVVLSTSGAASAAVASGAKLTSAASATAGVGGAGLTTAGTVKAVSATLLLKWIGLGVVGGVSLAGAAAVASRPAEPPSAVSHLAFAPRVSRQVEAHTQPHSRPAVVDSPEPQVSASAPTPPARVSVVEPAAPAPELDVGVPLAAEVAFVDRARALLVAGQSTQGLALLERYSQKFPEARLLPEVLFLQLGAYEGLGRVAEARSVAERLVDGFPKSPHAGRARKLLNQ